MPVARSPGVDRSCLDVGRAIAGRSAAPTKIPRDGCGRERVGAIRPRVVLPDKGDEICRVDVDGTLWLVRFAEADDELASVVASQETDSPPAEANVHWDRRLKEFDEVPAELPFKVRNAVYRWMRRTLH